MHTRRATPELITPALLGHLALVGRGAQPTPDRAVVDELRRLGAGVGRVLTTPWQRRAEALGAPVGTVRHVRRLPDGRQQLADIQVGAGTTVVIASSTPDAIAIESFAGGDPLPLLLAARMGLLDPGRHGDTDVEHAISARWAGRHDDTNLSMRITRLPSTWAIDVASATDAWSTTVDDAGELLRLLHLLLPPLPEPEPVPAEPRRPQRLWVPGAEVELVLPAGWIRRSAGRTWPRRESPTDSLGANARHAGVPFGPGRAAVELEPALARAQLTIATTHLEVPADGDRPGTITREALELTDHVGTGWLTVTNDADGVGVVCWTAVLTSRGTAPAHRAPALSIEIRLPPVAVRTHLDAAIAAVRTLRLVPASPTATTAAAPARREP